METTTTHIAVTSDIAARYDEIARATGKNRDQLMEDVLREYLAQGAEDEAQIRVGIVAADHGEFASDEEMEALFAQYGGPERAALRAQSARELRETHGLPACE